MFKKPFPILYAEDDTEDRQLFIESVREADENINLITVENGHEALTCLLQACQPVDLPLVIVSDLRMPLCDGLEMLRIIKADARWKHIPVILFSTSSSNSDRMKAQSLGVDAFFTKPDTYQEYIQIVKLIIDFGRTTVTSRGCSVS